MFQQANINITGFQILHDRDNREFTLLKDHIDETRNVEDRNEDLEVLWRILYQNAKEL